MVSSGRVLFSTRAKWLMAASFSWIVTGLLCDRPIITVIGGIMVVATAWCFFAARVLRRRLSVGGIHTLWVDGDDDELTGTAEELVDLQTTIDGRFEMRLRFVAAPHALFEDAVVQPVGMSPLEVSLEGTGGERRLWLSSKRIGDAFFMGFLIKIEACAGLMEVAVWHPFHFRIVVLPKRFVARRMAALRATRAAPRGHGGHSTPSRRGYGFEIRELRDHQPGDPFKHIAWRASARRGRLILREFESDLDLSTWIVLDVSPSMFWGKPGHARIDYALETAYNLSSTLLNQGHKAGLIAFDGDVRMCVRPAAGRRQLMRLTDHLLEVPHLVHEGRTETSDREVTARVARWFRAQEGLSLELGGSVVGDDGSDIALDVARLLSVTRRRLTEFISRRPRPRPTLPIHAYSADPHQSLLRAFARHAGVALPMDPTPRPAAQEAGLTASLRAILGAHDGPHAIVIISDLYTAADLTTFTQIAMAARRRRHALMLLCPNDPAFDPQPQVASASLEAAIQTTIRMQIDAHLRVARAALRPAGVAFFRCGPQDLVPTLIKRLRLAG